MEQSYYQILGVEPTASTEEIKQRFRELARRFHPDVRGDAASSHHLFVGIMEAYRVLMDPSRRADYDLRLRQAPEYGLEPLGGRGSRRLNYRKEEAPAGPAESSRPPSQTRAEQLCAATFRPGARVEVDFGALVLVCRLHSQHGETLHLSAPPTARRSEQVRMGAPVRLSLYQVRECLAAEAMTLEWVWTQPPLLVVRPTSEWREKQRRRASRAERELAARVALDGGGEYAGKTRDISAAGVSLLVAGPVPVSEGTAGRLTLQLGDDVWCEAIPIRIARVRNWLRSARSTVEIGAELHAESEAQRAHWQQCLARLGLENEL